MRECCAEDSNGKSQRFRAACFCTGTALARPYSSSRVQLPTATTGERAELESFN
jgi:hypothetical protein